MKKNMWKEQLLLLLLLGSLCFSGCTSASAETQKGVNLDEEILSGSGEKLSLADINGEVDVDLTALSSILVYAEVYNMMMLPEDYVGKTVKLRGPYYAFYYEATELYYHYVIIEDATACCEQGIEIRLPDDYIYPGDFPDDDTIIEVTGTFEMYDELGYTYYCIQSDGYTVVE